MGPTWPQAEGFVLGVAAKIRAVYDGLNPDSAEGNYVKDMVDAVEQLQNLFTEALAEASENYQAADSEQKNTARDGSVQHQERERGAFTPSEIQAIQKIGRASCRERVCQYV